MARRHYKLPPLTTLASFEAAARRLSFKDAATELNVTPGAVSHQIKALESELGAPLFSRHHRGVALTDQGVMLFQVLRKSFGQISATLARIRRPDEDVSVTISATTSISSLWLGPRLTQFWKEHAEVTVNQQVSDEVDGRLIHQSAELQIYYGDPKSEGHQKLRLFRDHLVPICSPGFAEACDDTSVEAIARMPLIHLVVDNSNWTNWRTWFDELGYQDEIAISRRVNNFVIALQLARDGIGVVLGWQRLVKPMIERGELVPLGNNIIRAPEVFFILSEPDDAISENARLLRDWLVACA
jgi:DNA-binding transcriptional LysR family regulator